jgi:hypothetical protein
VSVVLRAQLALACLLAGCASASGGDARAETASDADRAAAAEEEEGGLPVLRGPPVLVRGARSCLPGGEEPCEGAPPLEPCPTPGEEGCEADPLRITITWTSGADLNLQVIDPAGEIISQGRTRSVSGGHLDRTSRGWCDRIEGKGAASFTERVRWTGPPPRGTYRVEVHYWGECHSASGATAVHVAIAVGDDVHRFEHSVLPSERATLATFELR